MPHTFSSLLFHCVFATRDRRPMIVSDLQVRLWAYIGGIAREHGMKALAVGGTEDHVHVLLSLPANIELAKAMRVIKSGSSRWMHETARQPEFAWQEGYGAFSIGRAQVAVTVAYINGQKEHHGKRDFQAEFNAILRKHGIEVGNGAEDGHPVGVARE